MGSPAMGELIREENFESGDMCSLAAFQMSCVVIM